MKMQTLALGTVLFIAGMLIGHLLPFSVVRAQEAQSVAQSAENGNWVIQPVDRPNVWAYLVNTRTGKTLAFIGANANEVKVKQ